MHNKVGFKRAVTRGTDVLLPGGGEGETVAGSPVQNKDPNLKKNQIK